MHIANGGLSDSKQRTAEATTHQIGGGDAHHGGIDLRRARRGDDLPEMIGNRDWDAYHRWEHAGWKVLHRSGGESGRGGAQPSAEAHTLEHALTLSRLRNAAAAAASATGPGYGRQKSRSKEYTAYP